MGRLYHFDPVREAIAQITESDARLRAEVEKMECAGHVLLCKACIEDFRECGHINEATRYGGKKLFALVPIAPAVSQTPNNASDVVWNGGDVIQEPFPEIALLPEIAAEKMTALLETIANNTAIVAQETVIVGEMVRTLVSNMAAIGDRLVTIGSNTYQTEVNTRTK